MPKKIIFTPEDTNPEIEKYIGVPKPASGFLPEWYKKEDYFINGDKFSNNPGSNMTFKACVPFLDSLTFGYMIYTQQDIRVINYGEKQQFEWNAPPIPLIYRQDKQRLPVPSGHHSSHFAWVFPCAFKLPKGYSALITHPLNRFDLPFTTVSGVVDNGVAWSGKFTFWLREGFEGVIPKGTPVAQIIPFKTDDWVAERDDSLREENKKLAYEKSTIFDGFYKKFIHRKKTFL